MDIRTQDTIVAPATASGGALSVIRISGSSAIGICDNVFNPVSGKNLSAAKGYTLHYGTITDGGEIIDEVVIAVFRSPKSYTGEDMAEISCHGSAYIVRRVTELLIARGARAATAGEFSMRAYLSGKLDLSQAEAVAAVIASEDRASHKLAINQMKGGYSGEFQGLRPELLELVSLLELELDFSEEDVEFADRGKLNSLIDAISGKIASLSDSYALGNIIKNGVPVVIAGEPNAGKSTLLNALVNEEKAMVSDIAGTTRDLIEEMVTIGGIKFRFTDTAGLRISPDRLENMGIDRAKNAISKARVLLYLVSPDANEKYNLADAAEKISRLPIAEDTDVMALLSKWDKMSPNTKRHFANHIDAEIQNYRGLKKILPVSAKSGEGIETLKKSLLETVDAEAVFHGETIVTNARHYEALQHSLEALARAKEGLATGLTADLLAEEIHEAIDNMAAIAGQEITSSDVLQSIFGSFCIGK